MSENHNKQYGVEQIPGAPLLAAETLRRLLPAEAASGPAKREDRIPIFWHIFGGTVLSITALVAITLYQQLSGGLNELRTDLNRLDTEVRGEVKQLGENHGDLVKKEEMNDCLGEFNSRTSTLLGSLKEVQATNAAAQAQRSAALEHQVKAGEEERKDLAAELQRLRERLALLEGRSTPPHR